IRHGNTGRLGSILRPRLLFAARALQMGTRSRIKSCAGIRPQINPLDRPKNPAIDARLRGFWGRFRTIFGQKLIFLAKNERAAPRSTDSESKPYLFCSFLFGL